MADKRQTKATQARHERMLNELLKLPGNDCCADCGEKNPRWSSFSLCIFICVRCASIHRKMGTHISRVKSVTMDQWTLEQIEAIQNAGGNKQVNSRINPHPEKHPLPISDDQDHAMERYIRDKWEKNAFVAPKPRSFHSLDPHARLQSVPRRSSSVPVVFRDSDNHSASLAQLREMGFRDEIRNKQVLQQTQGNMQAAVEVLARSESRPALSSGAKLTEDQKLARLQDMGFTDVYANKEALRRSAGNLEVAEGLLRDAAAAHMRTPATTSYQLAGRAQTSSERQASKLQCSPSANLLDLSETTATKTMPQLSPSNPFAQFSAQSSPSGTGVTALTHNPFTTMTSSASLPSSPSAYHQQNPYMYLQPQQFQQSQMQLQAQQQPQSQQQYMPTFYSNPQLHSTSMPNVAPPLPLSPFHMSPSQPFQQAQPQLQFQSQQPQQPFQQHQQSITSQIPWAGGGL